MARVEPTPEQMHAAFALVRLPSWPEDLDAALADPVRRCLVHATACRIARGLPVRPRLPARPRGAPLPPRSRSAAPVTAPPSTPIDRKRLAAGDRDDD